MALVEVTTEMVVMNRYMGVEAGAEAGWWWQGRGGSDREKKHTEYVHRQADPVHLIVGPA
jgi:hypothetical protein